MIQLTEFRNGKRVKPRIYLGMPLGQWDTFAPKSEINYYNQSRSIPPPTSTQSPQYWLNELQFLVGRGSKYAYVGGTLKGYFQSLLPQYIQCDATLTPTCAQAQEVAVQPGEDYPYIGVPSGQYDYAPGQLISYVSTEGAPSLEQIISV